MKIKRLTSKISVNEIYILKDGVSKLRRIISELFSIHKTISLKSILRTYIDFLIKVWRLTWQKSTYSTIKLTQSWVERTPRYKLMP